MLHLVPIPESQASPEIQKMYREIKQTFAIDIVPLVFQYLANFDNYFAYVWNKMQMNIATPAFHDAYTTMLSFAATGIDSIYTPSAKVVTFITTVSSIEKQEISNTVLSLMTINAQLFLLFITLRENLKGVLIGQLKIANAHEIDANIATFFDTQPAATHTEKYVSKAQQSDIQSTNMLVPLYGSQALQISHIPDFFAYIAEDMVTLTNTEKYLEKRVLLEQHGVHDATTFTYPLGGTYQEILKLAGQKPYFSEMLYLLVDTFPTAFARLLLTSQVMKKALGYTNTGLAAA